MATALGVVTGKGTKYYLNALRSHYKFDKGLATGFKGITLDNLTIAMNLLGFEVKKGLIRSENCVRIVTGKENTPMQFILLYIRGKKMRKVRNMLLGAFLAVLFIGQLAAQTITEILNLIGEEL